MFITNITEEEAKKHYQCNRKIRDWLVYNKQLNPIGQYKDKWLFARTETLNNAILEIPLFLRF